ncbi:MAG: hypothetical protein COA42_05560 [Alteromonadaceae bacterium]|nr:MAG: hypothetical protein COA42_05560 [Alteromonadaceae bacterium]
MLTSFHQYRTRSIRISLIILSLIMSKSVFAFEQNKINIASSIRPLAIIAQDLLGDSAKVTTVLPNNASPHHFTLKPSQVRQLEQADIVLAVAPELETFLIRYRKASKHPERHIILQEELGRTKAITKDEHHSDEHAHHHHGHDHSYDSGKENAHAEDLHLWLNPEHVAILAKAIIREAIKLRPASKAQLEKQLQTYKQKLIEIQASNKDQLSPYHKVFFGAYHDGYNTFSQAFGLQNAIALTSVPDEQVSAKKITKMRQSLSGAKCLLAESGEATTAKRYARLFKLKLIEIDLLALDPSIKTYQDYIRQITQSVSTCLTD